MKKADLKIENRELNNSLTTLVQSMQGQSALTSFNPLFQNTIYSTLTIQWPLLSFMYKTHGILQTAIDQPTSDGLRGGIVLGSGQLDVDNIEEMNDELEELDVLPVVETAENWARLYGGGAIIVNTDQDPKKPLNEDRIKKLKFYAVDRWQLQAAHKDAEFFDFYGVKMHHTRVIRLSGKVAPNLIAQQLSGWGMSEIERMVEDFNSYVKTKQVLFELLEEAKIDVYRLKNLNTQLASNGGTAKTRNRLELMNSVKNFQRALVLDSNDEYSQKQMTFSGLAEVMRENRIGIASALRMPFSKLFGTTAGGSGLANSGQDDLENYNSMVESEVRSKLRKPLKTIIRLVLRKLYGEEYKFKMEFKPLRIMSTLDEESVKTAKHNRFVTLYDRGLLNSREVGEIMDKENMIPVETEASRGALPDQPEPPQRAEQLDGPKAGKAAGGEGE